MVATRKAVDSPGAVKKEKMEELTIWLRLSPRRGERCPEKASSKRRWTTSQTWHFLSSNNNNNNYCYFCYYSTTRHFLLKIMATESGSLSQHIPQAHWSSPTRAALRKGFELLEQNLSNPKPSNGLSRSQFLKILGVPRSTAYRISKAETDGRSKKQETWVRKRPDDGLETIAFCILARSKITITKISYPIGDDSKYPLIAASNAQKLH